MTRYPQILDELRTAYDKNAAVRDRTEKTPWKIAERLAFLERIRSRDVRTLLEIGAGTGQDSAFFRDNGLDVVATDPSSEMVARCRAKGLDALVADVLDLPAGPFGAAYSINALLHVPNADLPRALAAVAEVLQPDGMFFLGVYGGESFEGPSPDDRHNPPRFFCFRTDGQLKRFAAEHFEIVDFHVVEPRGEAVNATNTTGSPVHFQSLTLRKPAG